MSITFARLRRPRQGEHPYPDETARDALERLAPNGEPTYPGGSPPFLAAPTATAPRPQPTFTPRQPDPLRTTSQQAISGPPRQQAAPRPDEDAEFRRRMTEGLQALGALRGRDFLNDWKALPDFRAVARTAGWCGLHSQPASMHRRKSTDRWMRNAMAAIERQYWEARSEADTRLGRTQAEISMELDRFQSRVIASGD